MTDEDIEAFIAISKIKTAKRKEEIIPVHSVHSDGYVLLKGLVKGFVLGEDLEEWTIWIRKPGEYFGEPEADRMGKPATVGFRAIQDSLYLQTDYEQYMILAQQNIRFAHVVIQVQERALLWLGNRVKLLSVNSPEERYEILLEQDNAIFQEVNQADIATMLGITPNSLSRIIKRTKEKGQNNK
ncbi:MAG: Crp/Fnr family transcriptional regulator [Saprospiraceae bacterium]|nr:Crp/Fnr family transcriptional regulator [Saprospiraceae bacterium]